MGGGLLQLVAYGAQDAYLSGNPQITFWKGLFKRHTNFAMEPFRINLTGQANWGVKHSALIGRHADLLYSTYLEVVLPAGSAFNNDQLRLGYNLIKHVELDIGGQLIDRLYGEWLFLWDCLSSDVQTGLKLSKMVGMTDTSGHLNEVFTVPNPDPSCAEGSGRAASPTVCYIPLNFFYTRNPGAALPLIALQYHEVKINIEWNDVKFISGDFSNKAGYPDQPVQAAVYIDYIYLDTEERRRMAQNSHEYLIEQTQFNEDIGLTSAQNRVDLTFNHPVKELVWVIQPSRYTDCQLQAAYVASGGTNSWGSNATTRLQPFTYDINPVYEQWLQINGTDRMDRRYGQYFNKVQPYQHHTGSFNVITDLSSGNVNNKSNTLQYQKGAYMYSFALKPEEHQPSGTCNFSRIDTATIVVNFTGNDVSTGTSPNYYPVSVSDTNPWNIRVYAVNYNILRVMSGMGGLAYSN